MNLFLIPLKNELIHLHNTGFMSTTFLNQEPVLIKVHSLLSPVDSVARPKIQNLKQYNGKYMLPKYYEHWFLFVYSITIFCKAKISEAEFIKASKICS